MAQISDIYITGIKKTLKNYFASWLPTVQVNLGDVGILEGNHFTYVTNLKNLGINFTIRPDTSPAKLQISSEQGIEITTKVAGETSDTLSSIAKADAGIGYSFSKKGGFVVKASETYEPQIDDLVALGEEIKKAYSAGKWEKNWAVIVRVVTSPYMSILVSKEKDANVQIAAKADVNTKTIDIGNAEFNLDVKHRKGAILELLGSKDATPFFQLAKLKGLFINSPYFTPLSKQKNVGRPYKIPSAHEYIDIPVEAGDNVYFDIIAPLKID
jgi:hypothetical protein